MELLEEIADLHSKTVTGDGGTDGYCSECQWLWPCKTYHIAKGYGSDAHNACVDANWCSHEQVKM